MAMIARRSTLMNALHDAANEYDKAAAACFEMPRIAEAFKLQAADARRLRDNIEQADTITLED